MSPRSDTLAERLEQGARALADLASALTDAEWSARGQKDGRKVGVLVHHVATLYRWRSNWPKRWRPGSRSWE